MSRLIEDLLTDGRSRRLCTYEREQLRCYTDRQLVLEIVCPHSDGSRLRRLVRSEIARELLADRRRSIHDPEAASWA